MLSQSPKLGGVCQVTSPGLGKVSGGLEKVSPGQEKVFPWLGEGSPG